MIRSRQWDTQLAYAYPPVAAEPDRACAGANPEIFFPGPSGNARAAREICSLCPHRQACLDWALETEQAFGVYGGTSPDERARMLRGPK